MEDKEFFREATLKICGNLEIEEALHSLLLFLTETMPTTKIFLQKYDQGYGGMRSIAYANLKECGKLDLVTPLSKEARDPARLPPIEQEAYLFEDPTAFPIGSEMLKFHNLQVSSLIVMVLRTKEIMLGSIVLGSESEEKFNNEHLNLILLLREPLIIAMSNTLKHREVLKLKDLLADDNRYLHGELHRLSGDEIIGANFGLKDVMHNVHQVATLDSPVLLLGETGVGKDVVANAIHYSSSRSNGPFVSVNCGAIPETLIDSELFGHEKGAFTGALSQKRGRFERANSGTIFLDEIGELPLQAQVRLLKVLQDKEIERVGGEKTIKLDIRIIAATNRNLEEMVENNQFREDLWFRLNVFPIWIPPLRDRRSDIPALLQHFISQKARELKLSTIPIISPGCIEPLMEYNWPGNVRELQNVVERALILNPSGPLTFNEMNIVPKKEIKDLNKIGAESDNLDKITIQHIKKVLIKTNGKIHGPGGAAELLGINPNTLRNRMNKLGIEYGKKVTN